MGNEEGRERSRQGRSRGRQTVKRTWDREAGRRRNAEPGYEHPGLSLITDSFPDRGRRAESSAWMEYAEESYAGDPYDTGSRASNRGASRAKRREEKKESGGFGRKKKRPEREDQDGAEKNSIYQNPARRRAKNRRRKIGIIFLEVLLLIGVLVFAGYSYVKSRLDLMQRLPWDPEEIKNVEISEEKQEQMQGYWTIAVFGVDSRNESVGKGNNSDVNIICNIDQGTGEIRLVSVYRDTYLNINDRDSYNKINAAYLQGGPEQAVKALNKNLDLDIDDYATFNWKAVADAINLLGGIDVEISRSEFYYINAFISETVKATGLGSTQLKSAGMNHLDGVQAVAYGRLRLMDTDYARTERQRKVISLAFEKLKQADWATVNNVIQTVFPQVATSADMEDLLRMGRSISKYHLTETMGFPADISEANMGSKGACVIPQTLETNVTKLHAFLFGDENYGTTEQVKTISQKILADVQNARNSHTGGSGSSGREETREAEQSLEESLEEESRERETAESGGNREYETDEQGNLILRPGETYPYGETGESGRYPGGTYPYGETGESGRYPDGTRPYEETGESGRYPGGTRPYEETGESGRYPDGTRPYEETQAGRPSGSESPSGTPAPGSGPAEGTAAPGPGSGSGNSPGASEPGGNSGSSGPAAAGPGAGTDTGIILAPGSTVSGSDTRIEYSGPMGN